jgi:hypothetical protein
MSVKTRGLYSSPNGDRWLLCYDPATDRVFVRHEPNEPSGGHASEIHIGTFLTRGPLNPEHHVLLRLIATLVLLTPGNASSNGTFFANSRLALPNSSDAFWAMFGHRCYPDLVKCGRGQGRSKSRITGLILTWQISAERSLI